MRLSLSWLIVLILLAFIVFFFLYGCKVYEDYVDVTEGFANTVQIQTCPQKEDDEAVQMVAKIPQGSTLTYCYDNGVSMCSLSVPQDSPESCSTYYTKLLQSHGAKKCPTSMPNYFQNLSFANNVDVSLRGCTAGAISTDGKSPADMTARKCTIYNNQKDDMGQLDSCTNIKMLDATQCFSTNLPGVTKTLLANTMGSPLVQCSYRRVELTETTPSYPFTTDIFSSTTVTYTCNDLSSYKNWIYSIQTLYPESYAASKYNLDNSVAWSDDKKNSFCYIMEQTKINKNMTAETLKKTSIL